MITQDDLRVLDIIFSMARQNCAADENKLVEVINFRRTLWEKLEPKKPELTVTKTEAKEEKHESQVL